MTVRPVVFRFALASVLSLFVLKAPCLCGTVPSQPGSPCCSSTLAADMSGDEPVCHGCCPPSKNSDSSRDDSKLCCASCSVDCKQADAGSWNLGARTLKVDAAADFACQETTAPEAGPLLAQISLISDRALPPPHCSITISTHLLRI